MFTKIINRQKLNGNKILNATDKESQEFVSTEMNFRKFYKALKVLKLQVGVTAQHIQHC